MLHSIKIYRRLVGIQLRSQLQYRFPFALDLRSSATIVAFEFGSIALVMDRFGHIRGWTLGEVAFLYGLVESAFDFMDMLFGGFDPQRFGSQVRLGAFDQVLLRPLNVTVQILGSDFALRRLGRVILRFGILALALSMTSISWSLARLLYLPFVLGGVVSFFGGLFVIGATMTFWTVESIEVMNILTWRQFVHLLPTPHLSESDETLFHIRDAGGLPDLLPVVVLLRQT